MDKELIASAARAEELIPYEELEEYARDHCWSCIECRRRVYSLGFVANEEWGRCSVCGMKQVRKDEEK